jgi:flavodoxin
MRPIVLYSTKSGSTQKVADEIALELNCESLKITKTSQAATVDLNNYDLIVVGTGVHFGNPDEDMVAYLETVNLMESKTFALFVTWGGAGKTNQIVIAKLKTMLESKNQKVIKDFFSCYDGWKGAFLKRGHPKPEDLKAARIWAQNIVKTTSL